MKMSANNGSYQKYDGSSGTYQEIPNGVPPKKSKKWLIGILLAVLLGVVYMFTDKYILQPEHVVSKSLASSTSGVTTDKEGKLKLFDDLSK